MSELEKSMVNTAEEEIDIFADTADVDNSWFDSQEDYAKGEWS